MGKIKRFFRSFIPAAVLAAALLGAVPASAAAGNSATVYDGINWSHVYDYKYYSAKHPYIAKTLGTKAKLLKYFVTQGAPKGDDGNASFNVKKYRKKHISSLGKIFGTDYYRYYLFYTLYGYKGFSSDLAVKGCKIMSKTVCIDPGHQRRAMYSTEPIGPGSSTRKIKVSSGTDGRVTGNPEYKIVLQIGLKLQKELERKGYKVVMTRTTHDVSISNAERAKLANKAGADIFIRLHCDGQEGGSGLRGVRAMAAGRGNRYIAAGVVTKGQKLGRTLASYQAKATGQKVLEFLTTNEMTGLNWAKMPSCIIEMGYMSNPSEDRNLAKGSYQDKIAGGLSRGIDYYFTGK